MPFYYKLGQLPQKRHARFRRPDGAQKQQEPARRSLAVDTSG
jgi:hypothetical protein